LREPFSVAILVLYSAVTEVLSARLGCSEISLQLYKNAQPRHPVQFTLDSLDVLKTQPCLSKESIIQMPP